MKRNGLLRKSYLRFLALGGISLIAGLALVSSQAQQIKWGFTRTNINNPITPTVVTNGDGSVSITAGGGDTYDNPDSFTYAYQQVTGDFDIRVRVKNVVHTDPTAPGGGLRQGRLDGARLAGPRRGGFSDQCRAARAREPGW